VVHSRAADLSDRHRNDGSLVNAVDQVTDAQIRD
jgi:hypothetical protein